MVDDTIMIYILVESISGSYGSCSIPHNNRIAGNIFHHVAIGITCIRGIFILTNAFVTITIERTHRTSFFSTVCIFTIVEGIVFFGIVIRHFRNLVLVVGDVEVESNTPVSVFKRDCINTEFPPFIRHLSRIHVADFITISITDTSWHFNFLLQQIFDIFLIDIDRKAEFPF